MVELNLFLTIVVGSCEILNNTEDIQIGQQIEGLISAGDYVLNLDDSPFTGNNNYYKISAINSQIHAATITPEGVIINNYAICVY